MSRARVFWFTGLSGSGKSTIANGVSAGLVKRNKKTKIYDGDAVRKDFHKHLTFSREHIEQNNIMIANLCMKDLAEYDYIFVSIVSPFDKVRKAVKDMLGEALYLVYIKASVDEVVRRDPKGLYKKALSNEIKNFIGIDKDTPYEEPDNADLVINTEVKDVESSVGALIDFINDTENRRDYR